MLLLRRLITTAKGFGKEDYIKHPATSDKIVEMLKDEHRDHWEKILRRNPEAGLVELVDYLLEKCNHFWSSPSIVSETNRSHGHNVTYYYCFKSHPLGRCGEFLDLP